MEREDSIAKYRSIYEIAALSSLSQFHTIMCFTFYFFSDIFFLIYSTNIRNFLLLIMKHLPQFLWDSLLSQTVTCVCVVRRVSEWRKRLFNDYGLFYNTLSRVSSKRAKNYVWNLKEWMCAHSVRERERCEAGEQVDWTTFTFRELRLADSMDASTAGVVTWVSEKKKKKMKI